MRTAGIISQDVWGLDPSELGDAHRSQAKAYVFGFCYGKTTMTLAQELQIPLRRAEEIERSILGAYTTFDGWRKDQLREAKATGEIWTWWDGRKARRRPLWQLGDRKRFSKAKSTASNSAVNTPIQGTASDYCLASAVAVVDAYHAKQIPAKLVVTIHDALILEVWEDDVPVVVPKVRRIMTQWPTLRGMRLVVDFKIGKAMGSMQKYEGRVAA